MFLKGQGFSPYRKRARVLGGGLYEPRENRALKGHGFSRAMNGAITQYGFSRPRECKLLKMHSLRG
jgi:hypothetical protein